MRENNIKPQLCPLVSVVVASYNHTDFILEALNSVAGQTYPNLELIIVDDCSKDTSVAKIKTWIAKPANKKRFARLVLETTERNAGAHNTLNRGAALAHGAFINFLNSDDFFAQERIALLVDTLATAKAIWGFTGVKVVDKASVNIHPVHLPPEVGFVYEGIKYARNHYPTLSCGLLERNFVVSTGNLFVDARLFQQVGGFRNLKYLHDWDFILRVLRLAEPVAIDEPLYAYRLHGTNSFKSLANVAAVEGAFVMMEYFRSLAIGTPNKLAPAPKNWPVLFDLWVNTLGLRHLVT